MSLGVIGPVTAYRYPPGIKLSPSAVSTSSPPTPASSSWLRGNSRHRQLHRQHLSVSATSLLPLPRHFKSATSTPAADTPKPPGARNHAPPHRPSTRSSDPAGLVSLMSLYVSPTQHPDFKPSLPRGLHRLSRDGRGEKGVRRGEAPYPVAAGGPHSASKRAATARPSRPKCHPPSQVGRT